MISLFFALALGVGLAALGRRHLALGVVGVVSAYGITLLSGGLPILWVQAPVCAWLTATALMLAAANWSRGANPSALLAVAAISAVWTGLDTRASFDISAGIVPIHPIALPPILALIAILCWQWRAWRRLRKNSFGIAVAIVLSLPFAWLLAIALLGPGAPSGEGNFATAWSALPSEWAGAWRPFQASLALATLNVIGTVLTSTMAAYAFARLQFPGRNMLFALLIGSLALPSAATMIPHFQIVSALGLYDTWIPLFAPSFLGSAAATFVLRQFMLTVPVESEAAAQLDGAGHWARCWQILAPQIAPAIGAVAFGSFLASWNNLQGPVIYLTTPEKMPVVYALQLFGSDHGSQPGVVAAAALASLLPVVGVFLVVQRLLFRTVDS